MLDPSCVERDARRLPCPARPPAATAPDMIATPADDDPDEVWRARCDGLIAAVTADAAPPVVDVSDIPAPWLAYLTQRLDRPATVLICRPATAAADAGIRQVSDTDRVAALRRMVHAGLLRPSGDLPQPVIVSAMLGESGELNDGLRDWAWLADHTMRGGS